MEERQAKQGKFSVTDTSRKQKVENLPLLCVETIFKFTQTSKLTRLYSNDVPLPGAFWQFGLEAVLKKRLPLSIGDDPPHQHADDSAYRPDDDTSLRKADVPSAVFDASGALIASIRVPEAFSDSPLCDLIGSAALALRVVGPQQNPAGGKVHSVKAKALVSSLPNIVELTLFREHYHGESRCNRESTPPEEHFHRESNLKDLLPRLQSFTTGFKCELPIHEMTSLQHLNIPEKGAFEGVMQMVKDNPDPVVRKRARRVLSGLRFLGIWRYAGSVNLGDVARREMLRFVGVRCSHLNTLYLAVGNNKFKPYLAAFRALSGLTTLGMYLCRPNLRGLIFSKDETISTVVDLRLIYCWYPEYSKVFSVASLFPAVKTLALKADYLHECVPDALDLASQFCTMQVLPQLTRVNCFYLGKFYLSPARFSRSCWFSRLRFSLTQFIGNLHLPDAVDLSEIIFESLVREPGLLTAIYKAMQANSTTSLVMRGPLHRDALTDLQRHIDSSRENAQVTAWKDRDLGEQPGVFNVEEISPQTDVTIIGHKISGTLVGEKFTIRIVHQLTKRRQIFD